MPSSIIKKSNNSPTSLILGNNTHFPHYSSVRFTKLSGIGAEENCYRRDNSNIIKVDQWYYVYYNKGPLWSDFLSQWQGSVWAARSKDSITWEELGEMIPRGPEGQWDAWATYCPNILIGLDGRYYLYFTGQPECQKAKTPIHIGLAVSDFPGGPFERCHNKPIFSPTGNTSDPDGWRIDDASVIVRNGRYWMYYKCRTHDTPTSATTIALAFADTPWGPWERYETNPVISVGHEIMVWPHKKGVAVYAWHHGDKPNDHFCDLFYAEDGIHFQHDLRLDNAILRNPGGYFPDCYTDPDNGQGGTWGISFVPANGNEYLIRFDINTQSHQDNRA